MAIETDARAVTLRRIRAAIGGDGAATRASIAREWAMLPRSYNRQPVRSREEIIELLEDRLRDYDASVERVSRVELPGLVERRLARRGVPRMLAPAGMPIELLTAGDVTEDAGFGPVSLERFDGVMTSATLAIALTGTLVLQNVPGQGRRATTLIPDYHLCFVSMATVVETVPEAMARLQATAAVATTFISGPSATADIEMTRIKGVHGPRDLDVLLVDGTL